MPELSFRDFLETRDILKSKLYLESSLESDTSIVEAINDLLFVSALTSRNDKIGIHPVVFMNSMKNIIGDGRKNPSITLLKFAVDYVLGFEFRKNDQKLLNESLQDGAGLTAFIGDLEDACQNGDWEKGCSLAAHIFTASDNSRGVLDIMAELALQDTDRNVLFIFHLLRAFQFQAIRRDNWTYIKCILDYLTDSVFPNPHNFSKKTPIDVKDEMIQSGDLSLFSAVERLWYGDYVRIRGYRRELSHWCIQVIGSVSDPVDGNLDHWLVSGNYGRKFIKLAETIIQSEKSKSKIVNQLVILESVRALSKTASKEQLAILGARMDQLVNNDYR